MFFLDPVKLVVIGVVALLVLGPEKLPAAAKTVSGLLRDLRRLRGSLHEQVTAAVGSDPMMSELAKARDEILRLRGSMDPRAALYRSIGLTDSEIGARAARTSPTDVAVAVSEHPPDGRPVLVGPLAAAPAGPATAAVTDDPTCN